MRNGHIIMKLIYVILSLTALVSAELKAPDILEIELLKKVDINELVDRFTPSIAQSIIKYGLDPLKLPTNEEQFWMVVPIPPFVHRYDLILKSGTLEHLSHLKRYGNASLTYDDKLMNLQVGTEFKDLQGGYNYVLKFVLSHRTGRISVSTENVRAKISVSFNTTDYTLTLNKLELENPGRIKVAINPGSKWTKWLGRIIARITNVVLPLFNNVIMEAIQVEAAKAIRMFFAEINNVPFEVRSYAFKNEILRRN